MENSKVLLGKVGEWFYSEYYFDKDNNCFIEEKYHYEYLDTGTVFDGSSVVSPQQVYIAFAEAMNADGINALLEYCDNIQPPLVAEM